MPSDVVINVGKQFSRFPAGRFRADGPWSGERFRDEVLAPALKGGTRIIVELDDTLGYGSSFLEEAFGGLVRTGVISSKELTRRIELSTEDESLRLEILSYIEGANG